MNMSLAFVEIAYMYVQNNYTIYSILAWYTIDNLAYPFSCYVNVTVKNVKLKDITIWNIEIEKSNH